MVRHANDRDLWRAPFLGAIAVGLLTLVACTTTPACPDGTISVSDPVRQRTYCAPVCLDGGSCSCSADRVSVWSSSAGAAVCALPCADGGACPSGLTCQSCLTPGDCPRCPTCSVAACAPPP